MTRFMCALALILAAGALAAVSDEAAGCAAVPHHDESVQTADESALIVWDEKTKTEHFVRRASFRSTGYDFGFLVPTPNKPELDVATDDLFRELASITAPKVEYQEVVREVQKEFGLGCSKKTASEAEALAEGKMAPGGRGGVEVLEQKRVGDYDATVLVFRKGDGSTPEQGAAELAKWLTKHGYESPPAIEKWLQKYVNDQWCVTAFKIATPEAKKDNKKGDPPRLDDFRDPHELRAKPIRMSFKADRPFYPYREPETDPATRPQGESRTLRVFVAALARYEGKLGDGSKPWPGRTVWAGAVDAGRWESLFQKAKLTEPEKKADKPGLPMPTATAGYWLTEFVDNSSPRPGTDEVYFAPSADQSPVTPPPIIIQTTRTVVVTPGWHAAVYYGVPIALVLGSLVLWRVLRRA
jgi:hypothetical protein